MNTKENSKWQEFKAHIKPWIGPVTGFGLFMLGVACGFKMRKETDYNKAFRDGGKLIGTMAKEAVENDRFELFLETAGEVYDFK
jgi:hypothetical protein